MRVTHKGRAYWAQRLYTPDTFMDKTTWNFQFYPDDIEPFYELQRQGMKNTIKKDDRGYNIKLAREVSKKTKLKTITFEPPVITYQGDMYAGPIPDGSKVEAIVDVREHGTPVGKKAKAIRLYGINITELAEAPPQAEEDEEAPNW